MVIEVCRSSFDAAWGPTAHQAMADVNNNAGVVVGTNTPLFYLKACEACPGKLNGRVS